MKRYKAIAYYAHPEDGQRCRTSGLVKTPEAGECLARPRARESGAARLSKLVRMEKDGSVFRETETIQ